MCMNESSVNIHSPSGLHHHPKRFEIRISIRYWQFTTVFFKDMLVILRKWIGHYTRELWNLKVGSHQLQFSTYSFVASHLVALTSSKLIISFIKLKMTFRTIPVHYLTVRLRWYRVFRPKDVNTRIQDCHPLLWIHNLPNWQRYGLGMWRHLVQLCFNDSNSLTRLDIRKRCWLREPSKFFRLTASGVYHACSTRIHCWIMTVVHVCFRFCHTITLYSNHQQKTFDELIMWHS